MVAVRRSGPSKPSLEAAEAVRGIGPQLAVAVLAVLAVAGMASASHGNEVLHFQPAGEEVGAWRAGSSLRWCAVGNVTGNFTVDLPTLPDRSMAADSEGCAATKLSEPGNWSIAWTGSGPLAVNFTVYGGPGDAGQAEKFLGLGISGVAFVVAFWRVPGRPRWIFPAVWQAMTVLFIAAAPNPFPVETAALSVIFTAFVLLIVTKFGFSENKP